MAVSDAATWTVRKTGPEPSDGGLRRVVVGGGELRGEPADPGDRWGGGAQRAPVGLSDGRISREARARAPAACRAGAGSAARRGAHRAAAPPLSGPPPFSPAPPHS